MDWKRRWKSSGLVAVCVLSVTLSGCTSADLLAVKDREITELRSEKERLRESLSQAITKIDRMREGAKEVEREKRTMLEETEELKTRLRFANDQLEVAARDRGKLETRAQDAEAQVEMLERSLTKVKDVASDSVGELTDLRLRSKRFQEDLAKLRTDNLSLSQERSKLQSKVNSQHDELTKLKAVLRALRTGSKERKLEATITKLEKDNADLRGENVALSIRFENLVAREAELSKQLAKQAKGGSGGSDGNDSVATTPPPGAADLVYISDPVGLCDEVVGFTKARYMKALTGDIAWDLFDKSVVTCAALLLVLLCGYLLRSRRIHKLKREVQDLRAELYELEEETETTDHYEEEDRPRVPRKKPNLRRGGFSAVIAGPGGSPEASMEVEERIPETVAVGAPAPRVAPRPAAPPPVAPEVAAPAPAPAPTPAAAEDDGARKVIGARTWDDEESVSLDEESLERTQLIQLTPEDLGTENLIVPSAPSSTAPSAPSPDNKTKEMSKGPDLLAELKSAVNDKLDSL